MFNAISNPALVTMPRFDRARFTRLEATPDHPAPYMPVVFLHQQIILSQSSDYYLSENENANQYASTSAAMLAAHGASSENDESAGLSAAIETKQHDEPPSILCAIAERANVRFNGDRPWDIQVHDPMVYERLLSQGTLGFGEAYMDGQWECDDLDGLISRLLAAQVEQSLTFRQKWQIAYQVLLNTIANRQSIKRAYHVGRAHYDIGNELFQRMLDPAMNYSCGYWAKAKTLAEAQQDKMDLICRKLNLQPGEKVLEVGCGWGGLAHYMAKNYKVSVIGLTISKAQKRWAEARCEGLPVEIRLQDYRLMAKEDDYREYFDKVVSVGMFEHVGLKNYPTYFSALQSMMKPQALFLLHTIGAATSYQYTDRWIDKYIFPNGKIPSARQLMRSLEARLIVEDWHNFGQDYDRTLMSWWENFTAAWPELSAHYDQRFYRMWKYYLHSCAGFFRSRQGLLWQLVLTKPQRGALGERQPTYRSVR